MARMTRFFKALFTAIAATAADTPEIYMTLKQPKFYWDRCFKDVMLALNIGLAGYVLFFKILDMPAIIGCIEIGFIGVLYSLTTKPWTAKDEE
jgi:hypothetical protein